MKKTEDEKLARKLTRVIFSELSKLALEKNCDVEEMQMRLELAKLQELNNVIEFTGFHDIAIYKHCTWNYNVRLWYNYNLSRNAIYKDILRALTIKRAKKETL